MRKIISSILAVVVILTSFSMVAFAAGTTELYFNDGSTVFNATGDTFELTLKFRTTDDELLEYGFNLSNMAYSFTNATVEGDVLDVVESAFNTSDANPTNFLLDNPKTNAQGYQMYVPSAAEDWATYTITRSGDAETTVMTISTYNVEDTTYAPYSVSCPSTITINWPSSEPAEETKDATVSETTINAGGKDWTWDDAKAFSISATGFTKTTVTEMTCELTLATDKVKTITVPGTFSNPTVSFRALVVGIPEGTTLAPTATVTVK